MEQKFLFVLYLCFFPYRNVMKTFQDLCVLFLNTTDKKKKVRILLRMREMIALGHEPLQNT